MIEAIECQFKRRQAESNKKERVKPKKQRRLIRQKEIITRIRLISSKELHNPPRCRL